MQKTLDLSIKKHEIGTLDGGFRTKITRQAYMDNLVWDAFKDDMEKNHPNAFAEYGAGAGGELTEKNGFPPKMASYGSSSRMIYNLCKDIENFHFEYKLHTKIGGVANLDGFMETDDKFIFAEAKCREPYGKKTNLIECKYDTLYRYINSNNECNLNIKIGETTPKLNVDFSVGENAITCFDIKQMICHLLGIAMKLLNNPTEKEIVFVYLCYNPTLIEIINEKKKTNIFATYGRMCEECNAIDFKKLFETIIMYFRNVLKVGKVSDVQAAKIVSNFSFVLCDQSNYKHYIK